MEDFDNFVENLTPEIDLNEEASVELSAKSRKIYEKQYEEFNKWCNQKNEQQYTENVLLKYFIDKSSHVKASTLWAQYSMLKAMLVAKNNIDISKFSDLLAYLKRKNNGYKPKVTKILTAEEVDQFLTEAPDDEYLVVKVALILGIAGACRGDELVNLSLDDISDLGSSILFTIKKSKTKIDRRFIVTNSQENSIDFVQLCKKYMSLRKPGTEHSRFFVQYKNNDCAIQPVGKNTFGKMPQRIASFLNLPDASLYTGHCFRRTSASLLANTEVNVSFLKRNRWKFTTFADGLAKLRVENAAAEPSTSAVLDGNYAVQCATSDAPIDVGDSSCDELTDSEDPSSATRHKRPRHAPPKEMNTYCRLCLNAATKNQMVCLGDFHDLNYPSHTVQYKRNKILQTETYLRMIKMLMPNFDHNLVYNPIMCNECSSRLQMASDFIEQCMATQKLIQQYKDTYCPTEKMVSCEDVVQNKSDLPPASNPKRRKIIPASTPAPVSCPETNPIPDLVSIKTEEIEEEDEDKYEITPEDISNIKQEQEEKTHKKSFVKSEKSYNITCVSNMPSDEDPLVGLSQCYPTVPVQYSQPVELETFAGIMSNPTMVQNIPLNYPNS